MAVSEKMRKKLEKRKEDLKKGSGEFNTIIFQPGITRIRILPVPKDEDFACETVQFFLGKDLGAVISPATFNEPCAIYDTHQELKSSDDEDDKALAGRFRPSKRYYAPAIKYSDEKGKEVDGSPKLAVLPQGVYTELIDLFLDDENGDFTDPKEGYDVKIKREGTGKNDTSYTVLVCKPTSLPKDLRKKIYDPEKMVRDIMPSYEETEKKINAFLNLGDDEEEEAPKKKKKKPVSDLEDKPKKKKKKTSDDEPKKKKKKK